MVSIVVPIYNEEALIVQFHEAIAQAMNNIYGGVGGHLRQRWLHRRLSGIAERPAGAGLACCRV